MFPINENIYECGVNIPPAGQQSAVGEDTGGVYIWGTGEFNRQNYMS